MANPSRTVRSIHSRTGEDHAFHPNRGVSRSTLAAQLLAGRPQYEAFPIPGFAEKEKWEAQPNTVLGDVSEGVPGQHTAPNERIEGYELMPKDDFGIDEFAGNTYDEASGPRDMTRRPPENEWDAYTAMDVYNRMKGRD